MNLILSSRRQQVGISLIESLVALLVLALGILGMAGLQSRTLVDSRSTNARSAAVDMAEDLSERMQVNAGARTLPAPNPYVVGWGPVPAPANCLAMACTPAQAAAFDLAQWKQTLAARLPLGDAAVFAGNDPNQFGVLIGWSDNVSATVSAADNTATFGVTTGVAGQDCPADRICHLVFIRP